MTSYLLAGPAQEPVSLARAKTFLRIEDAAEDGLIETLVSAARLHVESITGRAMIAQTWRIVLDAFPAGGVVKLPVSPVTAISAVRAYDEAGEAVNLDAGIFALDAFVTPACIRVPDIVPGLPRLRAARGIEIDFLAGFGPEPEDVPGDLCQALLTLVAHWYEHRDAVIVAGSGAVVPAGFDRLVAPYKRVRL